jgi:superfamily II DNA/RNA helicase
LRYLVSTEAGGEGIDLQTRCHTLIHVDLPWNPMRLHQRVGRLNRYGQSQPVEVVTIRNPDTVESRIWGKLEEKLRHIMEALGHAMDEPEDLMQMVLGMAGPGFFNEVFTEGPRIPGDRLDEWFDSKTRTQNDALGMDERGVSYLHLSHCSLVSYVVIGPRPDRVRYPSHTRSLPV